MTDLLLDPKPWKWLHPYPMTVHLVTEREHQRRLFAALQKLSVESIGDPLPTSCSSHKVEVPLSHRSAYRTVISVLMDEAAFKDEVEFFGSVAHEVSHCLDYLEDLVAEGERFDTETRAYWQEHLTTEIVREVQKDWHFSR